MRWMLDEVRQRVSSFSEPVLGVSADSFLVMLSFSLCLVVFCVVCLPMLCCRGKTRGSSPTNSTSKRDFLCKKNLFALMLARLDEFDSLTPLIITPGQSASSSSAEPKPSAVRVSPHRSSSSSPPPPRRSTPGKTLIVPLNASRYRTPVTPLLGTPDSRVTSFETGTTKSCATIPEDDEESPSADIGIDLISIDRTSQTYSTDVKSHRQFFPSSYNLQIPIPPPHFQIPAPSYAPPDPPLPRPSRLKTREDRVRSKTSPSNGSLSSSLGSPQSSVGSGSPIDTTGSLSDSFFLNQHERSTNGHFDDRMDSDSQSKFQLHRIEEESEHVEGEHLITNKDERIIPRSISQQFEMMRRT